MKGVDFFNTTDYLEPRCKGCGIKQEIGINTEFKEKVGNHVCLECGKQVE
ncbi:MAG: hypothetical protein ACE5DM_03650 [Candidatus Nanoarchaeia archaeon]